MKLKTLGELIGVLCLILIGPLIYIAVDVLIMRRIEALESHVCPPCECQVEQESELELPEPRFPRGRVR